jgi:hypothetical protein
VPVDRLTLQSGRLTGTEWLRSSDLAVVKVAWDDVQDPSQPYAPGSVTEYDPPCALHWPAHAGDAWTSACGVASWSDQSPQQVAHGNETLSWSVARQPDGSLRLEGDGTVSYPDRPDSTLHVTQVLVVGSGGCQPRQWSRSDSSGGAEQLSASC